jgi:branched-chain amino acid transport system ATP-binding protein
MSDPKLVLLDEPSMGLAPVLVDSLAEKIKSLHEEGISILLVEQNAYLALELASRAYVLEVGSITLEGPTEELKQSEAVAKAYLGI